MRNAAILLGMLLLPAQFPAETTDTETFVEKESCKVVVYSYQASTIPCFFKSLVSFNFRLVQ